MIVETVAERAPRRRTVRERYDVPPPKPGDGDGAIGAVLLPRSAELSAARMAARAKSG